MEKVRGRTENSAEDKSTAAAQPLGAREVMKRKQGS